MTLYSEACKVSNSLRIEFVEFYSIHTTNERNFLNRIHKIFIPGSVSTFTKQQLKLSLLMLNRGYFTSQISLKTLSDDVIFQINEGTGSLRNYLRLVFIFIVVFIFFRNEMRLSEDGSHKTKYTLDNCNEYAQICITKHMG